MFIPPCIGTSAHLFWRLYWLSPTGSAYASADEIEMRSTPGGADQCNGGTASASTYDATNYPSRAFDNAVGINNAWISTTPIGNEWIAYQFPTPVSIVEFRYQPYNFGPIEYAPTSFGIEYSDDGTNWTRATTYSGLTWSAGESKTFTV